MAYNDSGEIAWGRSYQLGEYTFSVSRRPVTGSSDDQITATCRKGNKTAYSSIQIPSSTRITGWFVEANETEATVYAVIQSPASPGGDTSDLLPSGTLISEVNNECTLEFYPDQFPNERWGHSYAQTWGTVAGTYKTGNTNHLISANTESSSNMNSKSVIVAKGQSPEYSESSSPQVGYSYTHDGKTAWYFRTFVFWDHTEHGIHFIPPSYDGPNLSGISNVEGKVAWTLLYGSKEEPSDGEEKEVIVGRFAIEIEDAGGVGPEGGIDGGGGWTDPEDYDEDWEEGEPTHTLYVTVTGALSGRHNDPIEDPSYSYIPADKDTVKDYGCGGDGGHGGGGGAGASTVVVHKFATNQANSKEVTAIARRHGYGSGGGKGGKGGDGCILVYY